MITRDEQGAFHWRGTVDKSYEHKAFRIVFGVTGGICAFYIIASLALGGDMLGVALLCSAAALAVAGVVCWLFDRRAGRRTADGSADRMISRKRSAGTRTSLAKCFAVSSPALSTDCKYGISLPQTAAADSVYPPEQEK